MTDMTTQPVGRYYIPEWTLADRLRKVRRDSGLSQNAFAERVGVGDKRYAAWESGKNQPGRELIPLAKRIEMAFAVPATWVLGLDTHDAPRPQGPGGVQAGVPDTSGYRGTSGGGAGRFLAAVAA